MCEAGARDKEVVLNPLKKLERERLGEGRGIALVSKTHIDIVLEQLVRRLVVLQDVVVSARAGEGRSDQETKQSVATEN